MIHVHREDLAYAAAMVDGEGTVTIVRRSSRQDALYVAVDQKPRKVLEWLKDRFGGSITPQNRLYKGERMRTWRWVIGTKEAGYFLRKIKPYLVLKRRQAELGIAFQSMLPPKGKYGWGRLKPKEERGREEQMRAEIQRLNQDSVLVPFDSGLPREKKKRQRNTMLVHGLEILMPMFDYDFAFSLAALKAYREKCNREGNKVGASWANHLTKKFQVYFGTLARETKRERILLENAPHIDHDLSEYIQSPYG